MPDGAPEQTAPDRSDRFDGADQDDWADQDAGGVTGPAGGLGTDHTTVAVLLRHNADAVLAALDRSAPRAGSPLTALLAARTVAEVIEDATRLLVDDARAAGHTWTEIGQVLRTTRQAAHQRFSGAAEPGTSSYAPLERRAGQIVAQMRDGDWSGVVADWDATMRERLTVEGLAGVWRQLAGNTGALEAIGRPSAVRKGPFVIVDVPLAFEHGPMKARVTFNRDRTVAGLFILLPDAG